MISALSKTKLSVKTQTIGGILAIIAAVALPQVFHLIGKISGIGTSLGETFLPMHLPIILAGLLTGPYAAGAAGLIAPALSFLMTGMPSSPMLPFMMIELCVYGVSSGLLKNTEMPSILKVLIAQIAGRLVRAAAILTAFYAFGSLVKPMIIYKSILTGLFGIILQLVLIPLVVFRLKEAGNE